MLMSCRDGAGGSCISVTDAVAAWKTYMEPTKKLKQQMYLGSPAVTNVSGDNIGLSWLKKFLDACTICNIDFICIHWYNFFRITISPFHDR
jgi:hypothetical protein